MLKNTLISFAFILAGLTAKAQTPLCTNFDFEFTGNFYGWTGAVGDNQTSSLGTLNNVVQGIVSTTMDAVLSDANARHTIVTSTSGLDPCGSFPATYPGGAYSVRLGGTTPNYQGEILEQTFHVTPMDTIISAYYATVLNDGGHAPVDQPYFRIDMLDSQGNPIPNGSFYITAADSGSLQCQTSVYYIPWTTLTFNLSAYVNTDVTLRFTVAGCTQSGHYGYAYVDATCPSSSVGMAEHMYRKLQLAPNPTASDFTITLPETAETETLAVTVSDSQGKLVYSSSVKAHDIRRLTIDAGTWASGIYTVTIRGNNGVLHEKIVKH